VAQFTLGCRGRPLPSHRGQIPRHPGKALTNASLINAGPLVQSRSVNASWAALHRRVGSTGLSALSMRCQPLRAVILGKSQLDGRADSRPHHNRVLLQAYENIHLITPVTPSRASPRPARTDRVAFLAALALVLTGLARAENRSAPIPYSALGPRPRRITKATPWALPRRLTARACAAVSRSWRAAPCPMGSGSSLARRAAANCV